MQKKDTKMATALVSFFALPCCGRRLHLTGITFAGKGQNLDTGARMIHNAPKTTSYVNTRSISKGGGASTFRSAVVVTPKAKKSKCAVSCESLMLDSGSRSDTIPAMDIRTQDVDIGHEAQIGRISDEALTEHNLHPFHRKILKDANLELEGVNPSCGDDICLQMKVEDGIVADGAFWGGRVRYFPGLGRHDAGFDHREIQRGSPADGRYFSADDPQGSLAGRA